MAQAVDRRTEIRAKMARRWDSSRPRDFRWRDLAPLAWLSAAFIGPAVRGGSALDWMIAALSCLAAGGLYLDAARRLRRDPVETDARRSLGMIRRARIDAMLLATLGFATLPVNPGGATFLVFAAALAPLVAPPRSAIVFLVLLSLGVAGEEWMSSDPDRLVIGSWVIFLILMVGVGNLFIAERRRKDEALRRANEDVEEMAKVAERERIARDLHDLLGHTLSIIALKSELASKLADSEPGRAIEEVRDVERVSRAALSEVRSAVEGYRRRGLAGEVANARTAMATAGVNLDTDVKPLDLSARQETVLALVLREAVTNVLRHAGAARCEIRLEEVNERVVLTVRDDGVGGPLREGSGLAGMRERMTEVGGTLEIATDGGLAIEAKLPRASRS